MRAAKKRFKRERDRRTINRTFEGSIKTKGLLKKNSVRTNCCELRFQISLLQNKPPTVIFSQDGTNNSSTPVTENGIGVKTNVSRVIFFSEYHVNLRFHVL